MAERIDIALITVIPAELAALRRMLGVEAGARSKTDSVVYWRGSVWSARARRDYSFVLTCVGEAGNPSAAAHSSHVVATVRPSVAILMGIGAGIRGKTRIGDVLFSETVVGYEPAALVDSQPSTWWAKIKTRLLRILGYDPGARYERRTVQRSPPVRIWQDVTAYLADSGATARTHAVFEKGGGRIPTPAEADSEKPHIRTSIGAHAAVVATGEKLLRDGRFLPLLRQTVHGKIEAAEMEAIGFALACEQVPVGWLVLRGISDFGDKRKGDSYHEFASTAAAATLVDFIANGLDLDGGLPPRAGDDGSRDRLRQAAAANVQLWKDEHGYSTPLRLTLHSPSRQSLEHGPRLTLDDLTAQLEPASRFVVEGPPGGGKTFVLIGVADRLQQANDRRVPLLLQAASWAEAHSTLADYVARLFGLSTMDVDSGLGEYGAVLILDGWNEVPLDLQQAVKQALQDAVRRYRTMAVIASSRDGTFPPLRIAERLVVAGVHEEVRSDFLTSASNRGWLEAAISSDSRLDQLTRVPLFLVEAAKLGAGADPVPTSKYGLLRAFVRALEGRHASQLQRMCRDQHRLCLQALANAMQARGSSSLSVREALTTIETCTRALGLKDPPEARAVADALIRHHVIVSSVDERLRFQHQQFQEWFASERLCLDIVRWVEGAADHSERLVRDVFNLPHWSETILFVLERLREEDGDVHSRAMARIVETMFSLEPLAGSRLIPHLGSHSAQRDVRMSIERHLRELYADPHEDVRMYGLACMLESGTADFSDVVWPLVEDEDDQVRLATYRAVQPFPLTALGPEWWTRVSKWAPPRRGEFLVDIIHGADDHLIHVLAKALRPESSLDVRADVLESLAFVGADATLLDLVQLWGPETVARCKNALLVDVLPPRLIERMAPTLRVAADVAEDGPVQWELLAGLARVGDEAARARLLARAQSVTEERAAGHFRDILASFASHMVPGWLAGQLLAGRLWDRARVEDLRAMKPADRDGLLDNVLTLASDSPGRVNQLRRVSEAWPLHVAERLLAILIEATRAAQRPNERADQLRHDFGYIPAGVIAEAIVGVEQSQITSAEQASRLLSLVGPSSALADSDLRGAPEATRAGLLRRILEWSKTYTDVLADASHRLAFTAVLSAVGTPDDTATIVTWLELNEKDRRPGQRLADNRGWYTGALARMGAYDALLALLKRPEYLGPASEALAALAPRLPPDQIARACEVVRRSLTDAIASPSGTFVGREVSEAVASLAKMSDAGVIPLVLQLDPSQMWDVVDALEHLVRRGWRLRAEQVAGHIRAIADKVIATGDRQHNGYLAGRCAALLLLSDAPELGADLARRLWKGGYFYYADAPMIAALRSSANPSATQLLADFLATPELRAHRYRDLVSALAQQRSPEARELLLKELEQIESADGGAHRIDGHALSAALIECCRSMPDTIDRLLDRAPMLRGTGSREVVSSVMRQLASDPLVARVTVVDVLEVIDDQLNPPIPFDAHECIELAFLERRPIGPNTYKPTPRSDDGLRRRLFHMYRHDPRRSRSARNLLVWLERARLEFGRPAEEPHHPDVRSRDSETSWTAAPIAV